MKKNFLIGSQRALSCGNRSRSGNCIAVALFFSVSLLYGCSSRPYLCRHVVFPQDSHFLNRDWKYAATICDTRVRSVFVAAQDGSLLSVSIQNANGDVILNREVFFEGEERLDLSSRWEDEEHLVVQVGIFPHSSDGDASSERIAELFLSVPMQ